MMVSGGAVFLIGIHTARGDGEGEGGGWGEGEDLFFMGEVVRRVEAVVDAVPRFDADI